MFHHKTNCLALKSLISNYHMPQNLLSFTISYPPHMTQVSNSPWGFMPRFDDTVGASVPEKVNPVGFYLMY